MVFERKHKVGVDEVNRKLLMTNRAIIVSFENTASFQSDSIHYGILDIPQTLLTWFVIDWKVRVIRRPLYGEELTIRTWGRDAARSFSYRDFEIYVNDELCVQATSKWALLNVATRSFESVTQELLQRYGNDDTMSVFAERELEHMMVLDEYDSRTPIVIRKSDLDFNGHVNNVKYFDFLIDYANAPEYDDFRITYRKEIRKEDQVYLCHSRISNRDLYAIIDAEGQVRTIIECE